MFYSSDDYLAYEDGAWYYYPYTKRYLESKVPVNPGCHEALLEEVLFLDRHFIFSLMILLPCTFILGLLYFYLGLASLLSGLALVVYNRIRRRCSEVDFCEGREELRFPKSIFGALSKGYLLDPKGFSSAAKKSIFIGVIFGGLMIYDKSPWFYVIVPFVFVLIGFVMYGVVFISWIRRR